MRKCFRKAPEGRARVSKDEDGTFSSMMFGSGRVFEGRAIRP